MKRSTVLLVSCLALAGSAWLAHVVWGQTAETKPKRRLRSRKASWTNTLRTPWRPTRKGRARKAGHRRTGAKPPKLA